CSSVVLSDGEPAWNCGRAPAPVAGAHTACARTYRPSGNTGSTSRPNVDASTAAIAVYQATIAVARPTQPPTLIVPLIVLRVPASAELPIARNRNVIPSNRNTSATAPVVRRVAKNIRNVKIVHVHRYRPSTL